MRCILFTAGALIVAGAALSTDLQASTIYYNVAGAGNTGVSLAPNFTDGANTQVSATPLTGINISRTGASDLGSLGDFLFEGWPAGGAWDATPLRYIGFQVTALAPVTLESLEYTMFSGIWSNFVGPGYFLLAYSRDNFAADSHVLRGATGFWNQLPWTTNAPDDFVDSLLGLGQLATGDTVSFRWYMGGGDKAWVPAGFWNKSANDYNPTLRMDSPTPELNPLFMVVPALLIGTIMRR